MSAQQKKVIKVKTALLLRGLTIQELADQLERPRSTVSQAIHHNRFPKVRKQIQETLGL